MTHTYAYSFLKIVQAYAQAQESQTILASIYKTKTRELFVANYTSLSGTKFEIEQRRYSDLQEIVLEKAPKKVKDITKKDFPDNFLKTQDVWHNQRMIELFYPKAT